MSASGTASETRETPPSGEPTRHLLIQDFVVFGVGELLQLQGLLGDESHRQMKVVIPQLRMKERRAVRGGLKWEGPRVLGDVNHL